MPLTWQNVAAPNFSGAANARRLSQDAWNNGFAAIQTALQNFDANKLNQAKFEDEHRRALIGDDTARIQQQGLQLNNQASQMQLDMAKRDDQQAQDRLAMQPAAAKLLGDAQLLAGSGDPAKIEQARSMINDGRDTLLKAGWKAEAIPGLLDAERTAGKNAFGYKKDVLENDKFWENEGVTKAARDLATSKINNLATPDMAIKAIQDDRSITDPRIKAQAIKVVEAAKDAKIFSTPSAIDQLLITAQPNKIVLDTPAAATNVQSNPLISLIDKNEGAGNYDTLFGHAQKTDSPFSGIQVSKMTLGQLNQVDQNYGPWVKQKLAESGQTPRIATPMGRFQIVGDTRRQVAKEMGLSDDTVFDENTQNAMFNHLVDKRISGPKTMQGKIDGLRAEWAGFKNVSDAQLSQAITAYENGDRSVFSNFTKADPSTTPGLTNQPTTADKMLLDAVTPKATLQIGDNQSISDLLSRAATPAQASLETTTPVESDTKTETKTADKEAPADTKIDTKPAVQTEDLSNNSILGNASDRVSSWLGLDNNNPQVTNQTPVPSSWDSLFGGENVPGRSVQSQANMNALLNAAQPKVDPSTVASPVVVPDVSVKPAEVQKVVSDPKTDVQNQLDVATINKLFNGNSLLTDAFIKAGSVDMTPDQAAANLVKEGGLMPTGNVQAALAAIKETMSMAPGLKPSMAAVIVANNAESRDIAGSWWGLNPFSSHQFFNGDRFSNSKESLSAATRTNMDGVKANLQQLGLNVSGSIDLAKAVSSLQNQRSSELTQANMGKVQELLLSTQAQAGAIARAIQSGQDTPENHAALQKLLEDIAKLQTIINSAGSTTNYIDAQKDLRSK